MRWRHSKPICPWVTSRPPEVVSGAIRAASNRYPLSTDSACLPRNSHPRIFFWRKLRRVPDPVRSSIQQGRKQTAGMVRDFASGRCGSLVGSRKRKEPARWPDGRGNRARTRSSTDGDLAPYPSPENRAPANGLVRRSGRRGSAARRAACRSAYARIAPSRPRLIRTGRTSSASSVSATRPLAEFRQSTPRPSPGSELLPRAATGPRRP